MFFAEFVAGLDGSCSFPDWIGKDTYEFLESRNNIRIWLTEVVSCVITIPDWTVPFPLRIFLHNSAISSSTVIVELHHFPQEAPV